MSGVKIAILGTRGVPASYGGFETFAEELGARLAERHHDVTVYGRRHVIPADLKRRKDVEAGQPHRIRYKKLVR